MELVNVLMVDLLTKVYGGVLSVIGGPVVGCITSEWPWDCMVSDNYEQPFVECGLLLLICFIIYNSYNFH